MKIKKRLRVLNFPQWKEIKTKNILLIGLLVLVLGGLVFGVTGCSKNTKNSNRVSSDIGTVQSVQEFETKSSPSKVSIDLTPRLSDDGKLYVEADFNTHSGDLADYNLRELVRLEYGGKSIAPSSVPGLSWHHGGGAFIFDTGNSKSDQFTIKIKGIPEIEERVFSWP